MLRACWVTQTDICECGWTSECENSYAECDPFSPKFYSNEIHSSQGHQETDYLQAVLFHFLKVFFFFFSCIQLLPILWINCMSIKYEFEENNKCGFPGVSSKESACQCRRHGFDPGSGKIPYGRMAAEPVRPDYWAHVLEPRRHNCGAMCPRACPLCKGSHCGEKPSHHERKARAATEIQHSHKWMNRNIFIKKINIYIQRNTVELMLT